MQRAEVVSLGIDLVVVHARLDGLAEVFHAAVLESGAILDQIQLLRAFDGLQPVQPLRGFHETRPWEILDDVVVEGDGDEHLLHPPDRGVPFPVEHADGQLRVVRVGVLDGREVAGSQHLLHTPRSREGRIDLGGRGVKPAGDHRHLIVHREDHGHRILVAGREISEPPHRPAEEFLVVLDHEIVQPVLSHHLSRGLPAPLQFRRRDTLDQPFMWAHRD